MSNSAPPKNVLEGEFLTLRGKLLEIAAGLDRIDRAHEPVGSDPRYQKFLEGIKLLLEPLPQRAEKIQMLFSLPYDAQWRTG